jgi:G3E family GTPase
VLNRWLRDPALADTVVIVNEFGEIGLDHLLVESVQDGLILLAAGCLCCTVRGDLVQTLEDLLRRRDNGRVAPFRRVVVETTGLADPAPVLAAVLYHPYLSIRYSVASVVTVVDALHGADSIDRHPEALRQVAVADRILLSKIDLLADDGQNRLASLEARLSFLAPAAPIVRVGEGDVAAELGGEGAFDLDGKIADVRAWLGVHASEADGHGHHHHHDRTRHSERIQSLALLSDAPLSRATFDMFLDILRSSYGPKILRLKGLIGFVDAPDRPVAIHGVQHVLHVPAILPGWPDGDRRSRLVLILEDVDAAAVRSLWGAFTGLPALDRPDAAALTDNPLAPPTMRVGLPAR